MTIIQIQRCSSRLPFHQMLTPSETTPGVVYTVTVPFPELPREEWTCTCKSWIHRGYCKHRAKVSPCGWDAIGSPESQSPEQQNNHVCPRCGGPTFDDLVEDNERQTE